VRFWDVATRKQIAGLEGHERRIHFVTFSHDGKLVATAGMDQTVKLWDVPTGPAAATTPTQSGLAPLSLGGTDGGRAGARVACEADIARLCAGDDRVGRCLRRQEDQLSARCKATLADRGATNGQ